MRQRFAKFTLGRRRSFSFPENDYTDDGQLLGHIVIGVEMIGDAVRAIPGFPETLASELKHCIIATLGIRIWISEEAGIGRGTGS